MSLPCSKTRLCHACAAWCVGARGALFCAFVAVIIALVPLSVDVEYTYRPLEPAEVLNSVNVNVQRSEAYSEEIGPQYGLGFLGIIAEEMGISTNDVVATIAGCIGAGAKVNIAKEAGIKFGDSVNYSLSNLADAADYPAWDTLDQQTKDSYGTKENYDATKFNSLMNAFGLGDAWDDYQGSGGGTIEWTTDQQRKLDRLSRIGQNWSLGLGNLYEDVFATIDDPTVLEDYFGVPVSVDYDASENVNWPPGVPTTAHVTKSNVFKVKRISNNTTYTIFTTHPVKAVFWSTSSGSIIFIWFFDTETFQYQISTTGTINPYGWASTTTLTYNGVNYYRGRYQLNAALTDVTEIEYLVYSGNVVSAGGMNEDAGMRKAVEEIVFSDISFDSNIPQVEDAPVEQPDGDTPIYYPEGGVNNTTNWNQYITQPETRIENPYNPDNQTGGDNWRNETESNVLPIFNIHFEGLFPFSMLYDIPKLFEKVQATAPDYGEYDEITIPIDLPGQSMDTNLVLDLDDLASLGLMIRPFLQILLAAGLLFVTIKFWQGVLTG